MGQIYGHKSKTQRRGLDKLRRNGIKVYRVSEEELKILRFDGNGNIISVWLAAGVQTAARCSAVSIYLKTEIENANNPEVRYEYGKPK